MTEKQKPAFINARRRGFLQGAAVTSGAAVTGAAVSGDMSSDLEPVPAAENPESDKGYELTDHIKKYYQRARF